MSASRAEAVFVVGVHRSGTTLMRRILDASSSVAISGENHYLGHIMGRQGMHREVTHAGDLRDDAVVSRVVDRIYDGVLSRGRWFRVPSRHWVWLIRNVPREEFRERILRSDRSERAVFDALLRAYAERRGKAVIGEKTPAHVRYADRLLAWYPQGVILHMMRDPRAVYVSDVRRREIEPSSLPFRILRRVRPVLALAVLLQTTLVWRESVARLRRNRRRHPARYLVVRFEDLVGAPRDEMQRVCDFLGVPFEEAMIDGVRVVSYGQRIGTAGFDAAAADRWRSTLSRPARAWFRLWLSAEMRAFGYPP